jgi:hypothetical protein
MARKAKHTDLGAAVGLSFLDILCCGLGAVVLLLLIVRHGYQPVVTAVPTVSQIQEAQQKRKEIANERTKYSQLEAGNQKLEQRVAATRSELRAFEGPDGAERQTMTSILAAIHGLAKEDAERQQLQSAFERLDETLVEVLPPSDSTPKPSNGSVEGIKLFEIDRVLILVDVSASMLHRSLIDIIRLKNSSDSVQLSAVKWRQAMNSAVWAYGSISLNSRYKVLFFSEQVYDLHGNELTKKTLRWDKKESEDLEKFAQSIKKFRPMAGTNMELALQHMQKLAPRPNKVLIITDGLPNQLQTVRFGKSLTMRGCNRNSFNSTGTTTADCRMSIAIKSFAEHADRLNGVPIDIILFPLDGDSMAVRFYSLLASSAGGRLLTPSRDWLVK